MTPLDDVLDNANQVYLKLLNWINRYTPGEFAVTTAATVMCTGLRQALRGHRTPQGAYRALFTAAEFQMRWNSQATGPDIPFGIWRSIPVPTEHMICELARLYGLIYQVGQLLQINETDQDILVEGLWEARHDLHGYLHLAPHLEQLSDDVSELVGFMKLTLANHECCNDGFCEEGFNLWQHEDMRGRRWLAEFLPHVRRESYGDQQVHHPSNDGPPVADDSVEHHWIGGAGKRRLDQR